MSVVSGPLSVVGLQTRKVDPIDLISHGSNSGIEEFGN